MTSSVHDAGRPSNLGGPEALPPNGSASFPPPSAQASLSIGENLNAARPPGSFSSSNPPPIPPKPTEAEREQARMERSQGQERPSLRRRPEIDLDAETDPLLGGTGNRAAPQTTAGQAAEGATGQLPVVPNPGAESGQRVRFSGDTPGGQTNVTLEDATRQETPEKPARKLAMAGRIAALGGLGIIYATVWAVPAACLTVGWLLHGVIDKASSETGGSFDMKGLAETVFKPFVAQGKGLIAASQGYESFSEMEKAAEAAGQHEAIRSTSPTSTTPGAASSTQPPPPVAQALTTPNPRPGETEVERTARQQRERGTTSTASPPVQPPLANGLQVENKASVLGWVTQNVKSGISGENKRAVADILSHWIKQDDREVTNQILSSLGQMNEVDRSDIVERVAFKKRTNDEITQILDQLTPIEAKAWQACGLVDRFVINMTKTPELTLKFYEKFKDYFQSNAVAGNMFLDEISFKKGNEWQDIRKSTIELITEDTLRTTFRSQTMLSKFVHHGNHQFMELLIAKFPNDHEVWKAPGVLEDLFMRQLLKNPMPSGDKIIASQLGLETGAREIDKDSLVKKYLSLSWQDRSAPIIGHCIAYASVKQDGGALLRNISMEVNAVQMRNAFEHVNINTYDSILQRLSAEDVNRFREMGLAELMIQKVRKATGNYEELAKRLEQKFG